MKKSVLAFIALALCAFSLAETPSATANKTPQEEAATQNKQYSVEAALHSPFSTSDCSFTFITGGPSPTHIDFTSMKYCVTANGNIVQLEAPTSFPLISQVSFGEGYGICDRMTNIAYSDYGGAGDSGNWQPATVLSHDAKSVKIIRTTNDGVWTLTQTISLVAGAPPTAKVVMALTNNSSTPRGASLLRYADVDATRAPLNSFDATNTTAMGWNSGTPQGSGGPIGLVMQAIGAMDLDSVAAYAQTVAAPPAPCTPLMNSARGLLTETDGSIVMLRSFSTGAHATVTATMGYRTW